METPIAKLMDLMPYGLYIVGSRAEDGDDGMMADWVMQASFKPRLVAVAFENDAHTLANIQTSGAFTVNFLAQDAPGMALAGRFAQPYFDAKIGGRGGSTAVRTRTHHKLDTIPYTRAGNGCPVLDEAFGWLECNATHFVSTGDHTLVVAEVAGGDLRRDADPLSSTYTGWNYSG
jgi:flavin reductase (DIM6/NTAB) family NADH-FMN oxidoreductase RutF